jgi:hypothetical protein
VPRSLKSPKTNISNRISSKDITGQLNSLNHLQEISFAEGWGDVTPQNTNVLFSFRVGRESLSNKNKVNQRPMEPNLKIVLTGGDIEFGRSY